MHDIRDEQYPKMRVIVSLLLPVKKLGVLKFNSHEALNHEEKESLLYKRDMINIPSKNNVFSNFRRVFFKD